MPAFLDTIHGTIDRRILLNYQVDPAVLARVLPAPFRPKLFDGVGIAGVCMIRFAALPPRRVPTRLSRGSDNAARGPTCTRPRSGPACRRIVAPHTWQGPHESGT